MTVPAIVVGADLNGLGVVRSLARKAVPTYLAYCDEADATVRTRYPIKLKLPSLGGDAVIEALIALRRRFSNDPVLLLTHEATVEAVCAASDRISSGYRIAMPQGELMRQLIDKAEFQALAELHGFPVPRALHLRNSSDLVAAHRLCYPCVLKPIVKTPAYVERFKKAYKVESPAEMGALVSSVAGAAEMIAQEWIEGGDDRIYFCLQYRSRQQQTVASFTGRKLRSWPPETGGTASCVPAPEHEQELTELTSSFFRTVGFYGLGSMEFKRDARTGRFVMIEPTVGRTDFQEEVATLNGVNIPYAAYCTETGQTVPQPQPVPSAAWVAGSTDRWSCELQQEKRTFPDGIRRYDALWRIDDPVPWCYTMTQALKSKLWRHSR